MNMSRTNLLKKYFCSTASVLSLMLVTTPIISSAHAELGEITVTARKKAENLQTVPVAVSAFSGDQLKGAGIDSFDQVLDFIPNASQSGGIGGTVQGLISIRGISTLVRFVGIETGVGFYLDGVYTGRPENFNQELIDIERIEVLRGPQGALFGKNTIAGAINIITKQPGDEVEGLVEVQYGNYDLKRVRGYVAGPLVEGVLSGSLSAGYINRDGYVEHISGGQDLDTADMSTFRAKLRLTPNENVDITLAGDGLFDRGEPSFFETSDVAFVVDPSEETPFTTNQDQPNFLNRDIWGLSLTGNIGIGNGTLTAIAAYRDTSFDAGLDDDKLPVRFFVDFFSSDTEMFSGELRYAGSVNDRIDYLVGAYYFNQMSDNFSPFALGDFLTGVPGLEPPIVLTSSVDSEGFAFFGNVDISITERLRLSAGGRYTKEEKDATHNQNDMTGIFGNVAFAGSSDDDAFSPTVTLSYDVTDETTTYFRFAKGFKSAGFNTDFVVAGDQLTVSPEFATSYEIGVKSDLLNNRLRANIAGFYTNYEDLQLAQIVGAGVSLRNAAQAEIYGIEGEFTAVLNSYIDLNASVGYLHATYDNFPGCPAPGAAAPEPVVANCAGNYLNLAPKWNTSLGGQFTYPVANLGDFVARADFNYRSKVFFEPQNTTRLSGESRTLLNLRAGIVTDHWELFGWANNVTDETYVNFADDRSAIAINLTQAYGTPRTYGVTLRLKY